MTGEMLAMIAPDGVAWSRPGDRLNYGHWQRAATVENDSDSTRPAPDNSILSNWDLRVRAGINPLDPDLATRIYTKDNKLL